MVSGLSHLAPDLQPVGWLGVGLTVCALIALAVWAAWNAWGRALWITRFGTAPF